MVDVANASPLMSTTTTPTTTEEEDDDERLDSSKHKKSASSSPASAANTRALWITYVNIVLYAVCYQLQLPVEPFLVQSLSSSHKNVDDSALVARRYGQLQTFFSSIQTIGSPLVGLLLDRIGIRLASGIVFLASATSYAILASANSMAWLFVSKLPTALQHAFLIAQATAAMAADDQQQRAGALARMTTAYTIGATIGPAVGGVLAGHGDLYASARWAVVLSLVSVGLSLVFLPNHKQQQQQQQQSSTNGGTTTQLASSSSSSSSSSSFWQDLQRQASLAVRPSLLPLLTVKVVGGIAASMHATALPLILTQELHFAPALLGLAMSCSMMAVAAFGAVAAAPLTVWLGPHGLAQVGLTARVVWGSLLAVCVTTTATMGSSRNQVIIITWVLRELSSHALATGLTTQTTGAVTAKEQGSLLGLEHGLFSMARIVGPPLATLLLTQVGTFWAVAAACGGLDVLLIAILVQTRGNNSNNNPKSKSK